MKCVLQLGMRHGGRAGAVHCRPGCSNVQQKAGRAQGLLHGKAGIFVPHPVALPLPLTMQYKTVPPPLSMSVQMVLVFVQELPSVLQAAQSACACSGGMGQRRTVAGIYSAKKLPSHAGTMLLSSSTECARRQSCPGARSCRSCRHNAPGSSTEHIYSCLREPAFCLLKFTVR